MSENWAADARVGVPMFQVIAKQVSQCKHQPRAVRQIIDQQWLDEASKQQLREIFHVTDADLVRHEREAATEARRRTRERYGVPVPAGPCQCDAEPVVHPSGRIECGSCGTEWAKPEVRQVIDAQWLDEASKQQLRESFHVTDEDLAALERPDSPGDPADPSARPDSAGNPADPGARAASPADSPADRSARAASPDDSPADRSARAASPDDSPADRSARAASPADRSGSVDARAAHGPEQDSEDDASDAA